MNKINVRVTKGGKLFKPGTRILIDDTEILTVPNTTFWRRRLKDGDVELVTKTSANTESRNKNSAKQGDK